MIKDLITLFIFWITSLTIGIIVYIVFGFSFNNISCILYGALWGIAGIVYFIGFINKP